MIRIVTVDDEPLALKLLEVYASRIPDVDIVAACPDTASAKDILSREEVDCLFLDINMPDETGLEFVRNMAHPPLVVFTTAYAQFAIEGFRVNAVDYLLKPFSFKEFSEAIEKIRQHLQWRDLPSGTAQEKVFFFKSGHKKIRIRSSEIRYVQSMGAYLKVYLDGQDPLVILGSLKSMADADPDHFFRIHKSFVVHTGHLRQAASSRVVLDDGTTLPVGDAYREEFLARFLDG